MNKLYPKGSEWRKWDLHVHTPESVLNNGFGNDWDIYVKELFRRALDNDIYTIGITDYFTIEGYKKLREDYIESEGKFAHLGFSEGEIIRIKEILILPNIEFRLDKLVNSNRVNFHIIFSNEVSIKDIEENFLRELKFVYQGNIQAQEEKRPLTLHNLMALGEQLQKEHAEFAKHSNPLYTGMMNAVVSDEKISEILNKPSIFKGKYLIVLPSDEDLSDVEWNGQGHHTRKVLIQKADCLFASNPKTISWGLGKTYDSEANYIKEFKSLKPCLWGSDAHTFEELFTKNSNRLCWIKADPTFEGLKQITYEPEERVRISNQKPDDKKIYEIIDKVRFLDSSFTNGFIQMNQNLSSIIGGKSTGKSILLRSIASTADKLEYERRNDSAGIEDKRPVKGFEVLWKDGQISQLGSDKNPSKKIIYIPQSYLNRVVDEGENGSDIDQIIQDVLLQKKDFKSWNDSVKERISDIQDRTESAIKNLFQNILLNIEKNQKKKELGDENGIRKEIQRLDDEIKKQQQNSKVSEDDLKTFNTVSDEIKVKRMSIDTFKKDVERLKNLKKISISIHENDLLNLLNEALRSEVQNLYSQKSSQYKLDWSNSIDIIVNRIEAAIYQLSIEIQGLEERIVTIQSALTEQNFLETLLKSKAEEEKKLNDIIELLKEISNSYEQITLLIKSLSQINAEYYLIYIEAKERVDLSGFDDELAFEIVTKFKKEGFQESFVNKCFDGRAIRSKEFDYLTGYNFKNVEEHKKFLAAETWKIIKNELKKREAITNREAVTALFQNWFGHDYKVTYQGDSISDMSPGKKSFVLLRLLIDLDDSQCPILIDQPEDDLDNRSIYNQVVKFIRKRKRKRQIIIVTHNPNLVLGADAELVIIANQNGEDTKNKTFDFEYVSGSIENTIPENDIIKEVLHKRGIQEHICDILEGGPEAFDKRKKKYNF
ncbi:TrlF family AAA-like ATPase [Pareuzebyella sediminis]|uniref:TrlF family AAA-like ATPase n=1 Tax=Pareuzebyella sediminis TaxID=2607998 RepID=UPI0011ED5B54|nr:hypothetical protein [Pareuzebyella sediminis]